MFEIKLTIEIPGLPEALNSIAAAMVKNADLNCVIPMEQGMPDPEVIVNMNASGNGTAIGSAESVTINRKAVELVEAEESKEPEEVATQETEAEQVPDPSPAPAPKKEYTFTQISNAGAALCTQPGKIDQLVQLLNNKYGVAAITMIDKSRYAELAADLIALGAAIGEG